MTHPAQAATRPVRLEAGLPPQRVARRSFRAPTSPGPTRAELTQVLSAEGLSVRVDGDDLRIWNRLASATQALLMFNPAGSGTQVELAVGHTLSFAVLEWVICCYCVFFAGMVIAARRSLPLDVTTAVLVLAPVTLGLATYLYAAIAHRSLRRRLEALLARALGSAPAAGGAG